MGFGPFCIVILFEKRFNLRIKIALKFKHTKVPGGGVPLGLNPMLNLQSLVGPGHSQV